MRLDKKIVFLRMKMSWLAQDMETWSVRFKNDGNDEVSDLLLAFRDEIGKSIDQMDDPNSCPSSCKRMYFCELKKHHDGIHREGGLGWSDEQSDDRK